MNPDQTDHNTVEQQAPASLQLSDLVVVLNIIQIIAQRGAIQAAEMAMVGGVYDRLTQFLAANGALATPINPEETQQ